MNVELPTVTIVIPTLNAANVLETCLKSIMSQDYPKEKVEIILADGGSTDGTTKLANNYGAKVITNPLKTGESGKAVGVRNANGRYIALIDSDNILPTNNWLKEMITPLVYHFKAVGSEPWEYTWRKEDGFIARYCALIGMNDPLVAFTGNYDRINLLTGKWTETRCEEKEFYDYLYVTFHKKHGLPTIGANGTVFRAEFLKKNLIGDYLFDIDILAQYLDKNESVDFIKIKNGIIHTFCESNIVKFAKKQRRRVKDYTYHKSVGSRSYDWESGNKLGILWFLFCCITVAPLIAQTVRGSRRKKDIAWLFHPLACYITLWEYGWGVLISIFKKEEITREGWSQ